jgi:hypothetical protein
MADRVQLTDLDVIALYSLAISSADAEREELIEVLEADLAWLRAGRPRSRPSGRPSGRPGRPA